MGREEADFELVPHSSSHMTSEGTKIITKSLKLRADYNSRQVIFRSVLERLKMGRDDPRLTAMSNTGDWKLIPFAQNTLSRDQMTEIIIKQNRYLHEMKAISFINLGSLEGSFRQDMHDGVETDGNNPEDTVEATTTVPNDDRRGDGAKNQDTVTGSIIDDTNDSNNRDGEKGSSRQDIMQEGAGTKRKNPDDTVETTNSVLDDRNMVEGAKKQDKATGSIF